jgi:hypothetical protein
MDIQVWTLNSLELNGHDPQKNKISLSLSLSPSLDFQSFGNQTMMFLGDRFTWWSLLVIAGLGNMVELLLGDVWHDLVVTSDVQILVSFWDWAMVANIIMMGFVVHLILW